MLPGRLFDIILLGHEQEPDFDGQILPRKYGDQDINRWTTSTI